MTVNIISDVIGKLGTFLINILVTGRDFILNFVPPELQNIVLLVIAIGLSSLLYWKLNRLTRIMLIAIFTLIIFIMLKAIGGN